MVELTSLYFSRTSRCKVSNVRCLTLVVCTKPVTTQIWCSRFDCGRFQWPLAACSKAWVCGRSLAGIAGSNPTVGMDVCCECCVLLSRADHSSRGVLPTVVRRCMRYRNPKNEETMARTGTQRHRDI